MSGEDAEEASLILSRGRNESTEAPQESKSGERDDPFFAPLLLEFKKDVAAVGFLKLGLRERRPGCVSTQALATLFVSLVDGTSSVKGESSEFAGKIGFRL